MHVRSCQCARALSCPPEVAELQNDGFLKVVDTCVHLNAEDAKVLALGGIMVGYGLIVPVHFRLT